MTLIQSLIIEKPIEKAVRLAGGQSALAKQIGVSQGAVWKWLKEITRVSPENAAAISEATGGQVMPFELRPDIPKVFPHPSTPEASA